MELMILKLNQLSSTLPASPRKPVVKSGDLDRVLLVAEHLRNNLENARRHLGDRILILDRGNICARGEPETVFTPGNLARVYGIRSAVRTIEGCLAILPLGRCTNAPQDRPGAFAHSPQL